MEAKRTSITMRQISATKACGMHFVVGMTVSTINRRNRVHITKQCSLYEVAFVFLKAVCIYFWSRENTKSSEGQTLMSRGAEFPFRVKISPNYYFDTYSITLAVRNCSDSQHGYSVKS